MTRKIRPSHVLIFATTLLSCRLSLAGDKPIDHCAEIASDVVKRPDLLQSNVLNFIDSSSCFFEANLLITPLRTNLWDAIESLSPSQQQGSSLSSSGSTNAVSKPSGPTALAEEFGGADVTRGTSSTTVQWSPGKMLTNLALTGTEPLCLTDHVPSGCISAKLLTDLTPLTFKITANTSSGTSSATGTASNSTSTASAQQVNVNSQGSSGPSFSGFTVQYSLINSRSKASVKSLTKPVVIPSDGAVGGKGASPKPGKNGTKVSTDEHYYDQELDEMHRALVALKKCDVYTDPKGWGLQAEEKLQEVITKDKADQAKTDDVRKEDLRNEIENQYRILFARLQASESNSCKEAVTHLRAFYSTILEAKTYDDFGAQSASAKPLLAIEYDLNTPQNKPSYSSLKATANWQFGKATPTSQSAPANPNRQVKEQAQKLAIHDYATSQISTLTSASPGGSADKSKQLAAQSKSLAQDNTQPLSLTVTGTADIYNSEPSSSIPSASHLRDIQAGAELAYVFSPFGKNNALGNFLGSATAAAAYSYQDQTSPAILTGPALSDFTGLPSSTTAAFAKRGVIHLGQIRLGFGTGKNLTYPLAFTYSNRTELITHPTWGLQFGITYNLTSLFNSSGTSKSGNTSGSN